MIQWKSTHSATGFKQPHWRRRRGDQQKRLQNHQIVSDHKRTKWQIFILLYTWYHNIKPNFPWIYKLKINILLSQPDPKPPPSCMYGDNGLSGYIHLSVYSVCRFINWIQCVMLSAFVRESQSVIIESQIQWKRKIDKSDNSWNVKRRSW